MVLRTQLYFCCYEHTCISVVNTAAPFGRNNGVTVNFGTAREPERAETFAYISINKFPKVTALVHVHARPTDDEIFVCEHRVAFPDCVERAYVELQNVATGFTRNTVYLDVVCEEVG